MEDSNNNLTAFENEFKNKLWYSHIHHENRECIDDDFVREHAAELLLVAKRVLQKDKIMKARVKSTGEIIEVIDFSANDDKTLKEVITDSGEHYDGKDIIFLVE